MDKKSDASKSKVDTAREAGLTGMGRRFAADDAAPAKAVKVVEPKKVLAKAEQAAKPLAKPKSGRTGRPKKPDEDKPWIAAGVSRATWHRRQKAS